MSEAPATSGFLDGFFWAMTMLFALAAFADWLLRPTEQEAIKKSLNRYWEQLKGQSYPGIASEDAGRIRHRFIQIFGNNFLDAKGTLTVLMLSTLMLLPPILYNLHTDPEMKRFSDMSWTFGVSVSVSYVISAAVFMLLSIHVTTFFLDRIAKARNVLQILTYISSDLIMAILLCLISFSISYFLSQILTDVFLRSFGWTAEKPLFDYMKNVLFFIKDFFATFHINNLVIEAIVVSAVWPSIIYAAFIGFFI
ncbi:MAG: hypothetical protein MN733_37985, partial [Nitrososphaera sp.]|nr:hypothetical protein [Nitrososphaera sp.]